MRRDERHDRYTSQMRDLQRHYGQRQPRGGEREWREEYRYGSEPDFREHEAGYSQQDYERTEGYGRRDWEQERRPEGRERGRRQEADGYGDPNYTRNYGPGPHDSQNRGQWAQGYGQPGWNQQYGNYYAEPEQRYGEGQGQQERGYRNWQPRQQGTYDTTVGMRRQEPFREPSDREEYRFGEPGYGDRVSGGFTNTWGMAGGTAAPKRGPHAGRGPKGFRRSDERLHEDVCQRLSDHGEIDASDIEIEARDGEITLSGKVESRHTKRLAEDTVWDVPGVRDVHNRLRIG